MWCIDITHNQTKTISIKRGQALCWQTLSAILRTALQQLIERHPLTKDLIQSHSQSRKTTKAIFLANNYSSLKMQQTRAHLQSHNQHGFSYQTYLSMFSPTHTHWAAWLLSHPCKKKKKTERSWFFYFLIAQQNALKDAVAWLKSSHICSSVVVSLEGKKPLWGMQLGQSGGVFLLGRCRERFGASGIMGVLWVSV